MPAHDPLPLETSDEALRRLLSDVQRYAGWLARDHVSVAVRADAQALGVAMNSGNDTSSWLETLDKDIRRLPSGSLRKMLRKAFVDLRALLEPAGIDGEKGHRS